jgi:hypothetical protein
MSQRAAHRGTDGRGHRRADRRRRSTSTSRRHREAGQTHPGRRHRADRLRVTGVDGGWLYAASDVNGRALLTHRGEYQAHLVGDIIAGKDRQGWADHRAVPQVVFTDPEVAAVGRTEAQARDAGIDVKVLTVPITRGHPSVAGPPVSCCGSSAARDATPAWLHQGRLSGPRRAGRSAPPPRQLTRSSPDTDR